MMASKLKAALGVLVLVAGIGLGAGAAWKYGPAVQAAMPAEPGSGGQRGAPPDKREAKLPAYVIEPPDILLVEYACPYSDDPVKITGRRLVRPDGTIGLGQLGAVSVGGLTVGQAGRAIGRHLAGRLDGFDPRRLTVDVLAYNSKAFYMIIEGPNGEEVHRLPATGSDTVLDAIAQINGLSGEAVKKHVWIARPAPAGGPEQILPVDWKAITQDGQSATNYQLLPGDRLFVKSHAPKQAETAPRKDAAAQGAPDPAREVEAAIRKAMSEARSPEEQRRVVETLEVLTKRLRQQLPWPEVPTRPAVIP
jgi:protein involved in polysaccharide export with SLBB domain